MQPCSQKKEVILQENKEGKVFYQKSQVPFGPDKKTQPKAEVLVAWDRDESQSEGLGEPSGI